MCKSMKSWRPAPNDRSLKSWLETSSHRPVAAAVISPSKDVEAALWMPSGGLLWPTGSHVVAASEANLA